MLNKIKGFFRLQKKTVWNFDESALAEVKPGQTIVANYGFMEKDLGHEFTKLDDNLWISTSGQRVKNSGIFMPFTILQDPTTKD